MKFTTTALWADTLEAVRKIKKLTREPQVLILQRLVVAELERLEKLEDNRRQVRR